MHFAIVEMNGWPHSPLTRIAVNIIGLLAVLLIYFIPRLVILLKRIRRLTTWLIRGVQPVLLEGNRMPGPDPWPELKDERLKQIGMLIKQELASLSSYSALKVSEIFDNCLEYIAYSLRRLLFFFKIFSLAVFLLGIFAAANDANIAFRAQAYLAQEPGDLGALWAGLADAAKGPRFGLAVAFVYLVLYALGTVNLLDCKRKIANNLLQSTRQ
jgi:hypothetical protein